MTERKKGSTVANAIDKLAVTELLAFADAAEDAAMKVQATGDAIADRMRAFQETMRLNLRTLFKSDAL